MNVKTWPILAIAAVLGGSLATSLWPERFAFTQRLPGGDKGVHFVVMGLLCMTLVLSLSGTRWRGMRLGPSWWVTGSLIATGLEEGAQRFIPGRVFSWLDLAYSWGGVLVFGTVAVLWLRTRRAPERIAG